MNKTIIVPDDEVEAGKPDWLKQLSNTSVVHQLYMNSLRWRAEIHRAEGDETAQNRILDFCADWVEAQNTITLAEAERRWRKTNLRQNPIDLPHRWQSDDGRGTWLTTIYAMEEAFGPEPKS